MSDEGVILDTEMKRNLLIQSFVAFQSRRSAIPSHFCGETNQLGEGEKRGRFSRLSLKLFLLIVKTTFLLLFMCTNKHRTMNILRGQTVWKCASLSAYFNNYGNHPRPPILFYDNRLSGNGNKHFCLPTWLDSMSYDPVLSEHDPSRRQRGRQADW